MSNHRTTYNTLLFQKLLNLRDGVSPFTLILDSLEQSGLSLMKEFGKRAKISNIKILFISFTTPYKKVPLDTYTFVCAHNKSLVSLQDEISSHITSWKKHNTNESKYLLIIDNLTPLATNHIKDLSSFLSSLLTSSSISLLAIYHHDIPISHHLTPYLPDPLHLLQYLATAILTVSSLEQIIACQRAKQRSLPVPLFGLHENVEGVLMALKSKNVFDVVVHMELRRRSGRAVSDIFVLSPSTSIQASNVILLHDHPDYAFVPVLPDIENEDQTMGLDMTFDLSLSEKQKRDRDNVVLPYFDAQRESGINGPGEGGRILYQMGTEDHEDFDDEEDEI